LVKKADLSISVNSSYLSFLKKNNKNTLIIKYDIEKMDFDMDRQAEKIYDAYFLGRFHEQKGIFELIDIVDRLKKKVNKNFKCAMIGNQNCPIGKEFIAMIKKRGLEENFIFFGSKTGKEKYEIINRSKIFLFPSYYESFGIVYLEAIAMGIPTVEYDLPIYTDHKYGNIKVPFLNNEIFADKIAELLTDKALYAKISAEGVEYAKEFSWDKTAEIMLDKVNNSLTKDV
jgi:glycosyltransferase involved in cell wall biosynthesis